MMMNCSDFTPFVQRGPLGLSARTQGAGDTVICLHSSTGSHAQWRGLAEALLDRCTLITPNLHGHGVSPAWPTDAASKLHVDAHAVCELLPRTLNGGLRSGIHLIGHSYGGAVALQIALRHPRWVRSLTLYEPVPFGVMRRQSPGDVALGEIEHIAQSVEGLVRLGDLAGAARVFVAYWGGAAAWEAMTAAQRVAVAARISTVPRHFEALLNATWSPALLACLTMPVLLIQGSSTRAPARRVAELLAGSLPQLQRIELAGAGHLGPMTHEPLVTAAMLRHLTAHGLRRQAQPSCA